MSKLLKRKKKVLLVLFLVAFACSLSLFLHPIREFIILFGEKILARQLTHTVWHERIFQYESCLVP